MHISFIQTQFVFVLFFLLICLASYLAARFRARHASRIRLAGDDGEEQPQKPAFPRIAIAPIVFLSVSGLVVQISMLVHGINWHNRWESNTFIWWFMQVFYITAHSFLLIHSATYPNIVTYTITNAPFAFPKISFKCSKSLANPGVAIQTVGFFLTILPLAASLPESDWYNKALWFWHGGFRTYYVPTRLQPVIGALLFILGTVYDHVYAEDTHVTQADEGHASAYGSTSV